MDGLSHLLGGHRGREAFVLRCEMAPPWSFRVEDHSTVAVVIVIAGSAVLSDDGGPPVRLGPGDVAVVKGARPYVLADEQLIDGLARQPTVVIEPGQHCRSLVGPEVGADVSRSMLLAGGAWGNSAGGPTVFLTGVYELSHQVGGRLIVSLPAVAVLPAPSCEPALVALLTRELATDQLGRSAILDRYVDLVLLSGVRAWFARPDADPPRWWAAQEDPVVGQVLALMHDQPGQPWTLVGLAEVVGYSRASVARRFSGLLGQSPMAYLTQWRLDLAADLLRDRVDSVEVVGRTVGYANPFAFSTAFKRAHGVSPRAFRATAA